MLTYLTSIGCVLHRRITHPESLPHCRWSLGKWGIPINVAGLLYACWAFFWAFWPTTMPVTSESFNWSSVMFSGVTLLSIVMYVTKGHKVYEGPAVLVAGRRKSKQDSERDSSASE